MGSINSLVTDILQKIIFLFSSRKKFIQVWNNFDDSIFIFG